MKITVFNIQNFSLRNKSSFSHQNPIKFKGEKRQDSFEYSKDGTSFIEEYKAQTQERIKKLNEAYGKVYRQINLAQILSEKINLDQKELVNLTHLANSAKKKDDFRAEIKKIVEQYAIDFELDDDTQDFLVSIFKKALSYIRTSDVKNETIKAQFNLAIVDLRTKQRTINGQLKTKRNNLNSISPSYTEIIGTHGIQSAQSRSFEEIIQGGFSRGYLIDLWDERYSDISTSAKNLLLRSFETVRIGRDFYPTDDLENIKFLASLAGLKVYSQVELQDLYGIINPAEIFPNAKIFNLKNGGTLIGFSQDDTAQKILEDISDKKVATIFGLNKNQTTKITSNTPFSYQKYSSSDTLSAIDFMFVILDDENNQRLIENTRYRNCVVTLPFKYNENGIIDMNDEYNRNLLSSTHLLDPKKSQYFFKSLGSPKPVKIDILTKALEDLGFSTSNILIDLIKNGKLDGKKGEDGQYYVTIDTKYRLGKNKNYDVLHSLRRQDPKIRTSKEFARALRISQKRLDYAILTGEVEIIEEYINSSDKELRYINISTPKNQEFIKKIQFEREMESLLKAQKREAIQKERIEKQDLRQRIQGVKMALVWEFMPTTRQIASTLASKDGYVAKLLAKEDDPNEVLTQFEEMKINSYRKEVWLQAGTEELKEAHKRANAIMKTFKEKGLSAIDAKYLPIFEKYGFCQS